MQAMKTVARFSFTRFRSTFLNSSICAQVKQSGVFRTAKSLAATWELVEEKPLAIRYASLSIYLEGSLGLAVHRYYRENVFTSGYGIDYVGEVAKVISSR
jgi:hypothetical protein